MLTLGRTSLRGWVCAANVLASTASGLGASGYYFSVAFQDAKHTGDGLIYILCKGWYRHRGLLRGAPRAMRDGVTAVAHLAPHCPRRSALTIPQPPLTTLSLAMMPRIPIKSMPRHAPFRVLPISTIGTILETRLSLFHHFTHFPPFYPFLAPV